MTPSARPSARAHLPTSCASFARSAIACSPSSTEHAGPLQRPADALITISAARSTRSKSVFEVRQARLNVVEHDGGCIEAHVARVHALPTQPTHGRPPNALGLVPIEGGDRIHHAIVTARTNLAEHEQIAATGDKIDLEAT